MNSLKTLLVFSQFLCVFAQAHAPRILDTDSTESQPYVIERPYEKSLALYARFESEGDVDAYRFDVTNSDLVDGKLHILIGSLVPACAPLKNLFVNWELKDPSGNSIMRREGQMPPETWYEPYTRHYYYQQSREEILLTQAGTYNILVSSQNMIKGDYVLEFGDKEIWSIAEILRTLWSYPRLIFESEIKTKDCITSKSP